MPVKIKFYHSILWKLLFSFLAVILLTVAIIIVMTFFGPRKAQIPEIRKDLYARNDMIIRKIRQEFEQEPDSRRMEELAFSYGLMTNSTIVYLTPGGIGQIQYQAQLPGGSYIPVLTLTENELRQLHHGRTIVGEKIETDERSESLLFYSAAPLGTAGKPQGYLMIITPFGPPRPRRASLSFVLLQGVLAALIIASITAAFLSWNFTRPLRMMEKCARKMSKGDFTEQMNLQRNDELGSLSNSFDTMALELRNNIETRLRLMGDISHELNTPLAAIRINLEACIDGIIEEEEEKAQTLQAMLNQTNRMSLLADDILELAKFESGAIKMTMNTFQASDAVRQVLESTRHLIDEKGTILKTNFSCEDIPVTGDKNRIVQVLQNLVNNAVFHNPEKVNITISVVKENRRVLFQVEDDGIGIPKEEFSSVFNRFHKVDRSRTRKFQSSGLGLAIVKEIIFAHGSEISIEQPANGKGVRFSFHLTSAT